MKSKFYISIMIVIFVSSICSTVNADSNQEETLLMNSYFSYLKTGDTKAILDLLTEPILSQKGELLSANSSYPSFLMRTYSKASLNVLDIIPIDDTKRFFDVEIVFSQEEATQKIRYIIKNCEGIWKISDEIPK